MPRTKKPAPRARARAAAEPMTEQAFDAWVRGVIAAVLAVEGYDAPALDAWAQRPVREAA